jgi:hypothetical protein
VNFTGIFVATMPGPVYDFVAAYLTNVQPPIVDGALLFFLVVLSATNVVIGMFGMAGNDMEAGRPITFVSQEVLLIVAFLVASILFLFAQAATEG